MLLLNDVRKTYREPDGSPLPILDIKHFHVEAGEQVVLTGKSGCGKTTLLHVIAGISRPDSGLVRIDGCDITRLSEAGCDRLRADKIGYVFQTFNLLPGFSALENVLLGMTFAGRSTDAPRARKLLERVGL
ncbi:MAG: ATP-binding cassette domain-containing protein, partial [Pirellulales bacterium]